MKSYYSFLNCIKVLLVEFATDIFVSWNEWIEDSVIHDEDSEEGGC